MPPVTSGVVLDPGRRGRRIVWEIWILTLTIAAILYARKATDGGSAFVRWQPQVLMLMQDHINIYDKLMYPNPPIVPITLYPLMVLPTVVGAMTWFVIKAALATGSALLCFRMARESNQRIPSWALGLTLLLSARPILSDLHHGNNNLIILSLIVATLYAWRKGYDVLAGLILALAITYKVTPALFVPYFLYKRSWRMVSATGVGMALFLFLVPSLVLGPEFNLQCLGWWWHRILSPFFVEGVVGPPEINQSMVGVIVRLLTQGESGGGRYDILLDLNLVSWDPAKVVVLAKALSIGLVGLLAFFCRTRSNRRDDARMLGEFSLVVLTMLFVSERSWKHHYVTLLLPYTYLVCRVGLPSWSRNVRLTLAGLLTLSALLMVSTSSEVGGFLAGGMGHKVAQFYGMFFWAGVTLYIATAWRVLVEGRRVPGEANPPNRELPAPHLRAVLLRKLARR